MHAKVRDAFVSSGGWKANKTEDDSNRRLQIMMAMSPTTIVMILSVLMVGVLVVAIVMVVVVVVFAIDMAHQGVVLTYGSGHHRPTFTYAPASPLEASFWKKASAILQQV